MTFDPKQWPLNPPLPSAGSGKGGSTIAWYTGYNNAPLPPGLDPWTVLDKIPDSGRGAGATIGLNDAFTITQNFQYDHSLDFNPVPWAGVVLTDASTAQLPIVGNYGSKVRPGADVILTFMFQLQPGPVPALLLMPTHPMLASTTPFLFPATSPSPGSPGHNAQFMAFCPGVAGIAVGAAISADNSTWAPYGGQSVTLLMTYPGGQYSQQDANNAKIPGLRTWCTTAGQDVPHSYYSVWPNPDDVVVDVELKDGVTTAYPFDNTWFYGAVLRAQSRAVFTQFNQLAAPLPNGTPNSVYYQYTGRLQYTAIWGGVADTTSPTGVTPGGRMEVVNLPFGGSAPCFQALYPLCNLTITMSAALLYPDDPSPGGAPSPPLPDYTLSYILPQRYWVVANTYALTSKEVDPVTGKPRVMFVQVRPTATFGSNIYYYFDASSPPAGTSSEETATSEPLTKEQLQAETIQGSVIGVGGILCIVLVVLIILLALKRMKT